MKKGLLITICLMMSMLLLPGGTASWGDTLRIEGGVSVVEPETEPELESDPDLAFEQESEFEIEPEPKAKGKPDQEESRVTPDNDKYMISIAINGQGSTNPTVGSYAYKEKTEVTLESSPADGWKLSKWVVNGEDIKAASQIIVKISGDMFVEAVFIEIETSSDYEEIDEKVKDIKEKEDKNEIIEDLKDGKEKDKSDSEDMENDGA